MTSGPTVNVTRFAASFPDAPRDLICALPALLPNDGRGIDLLIGWAPTDPTHLLDRGETLSLPSIRIDVDEVRQRNDRRHWLARPLDDDALAGRGRIHDLAESAPNVEGRHCSHSGIIAP
jgi:hypothetical protein